jgi:hypothetical protein
MAETNRKRLLVGALAGGVVWLIWSMAINFLFLGKRYMEAQESGIFLTEPRYPFFMVAWCILLFVLAYILAWLYAGVRATYGAGPLTALVLGAAVGFAMGFPLSFSTATWVPYSRVFPLWWMLELWVGAILATFVAGWLYRDE